MDELYIELSVGEVALATVLILVNGAISLTLRLKLERLLLLASLRTVIQLWLIGIVLESVFSVDRWQVVLALVLVMTLVAGIAAVRQTPRRYPGIFFNSIVSVWCSSWLILAFAMGTVLGQVSPWYHPQYLIPIAGMILGNSMNGISLGLSRFGDELVTHRDQVELLLSLGATRWEAARASVRKAVHTGMIPIINSMMVVGIVSLPGMMTGQLLAGIEPGQAVRYQIIIMFLIASGTALGTVSVVLLSFRRLFNSRHQFCHDRLVDRKAR